MLPNNLRKVIAITCLPTLQGWVGTNTGEGGWKMTQAKVRPRQELRQASRPGLWSRQHHRALGKVSVE